MKRVPIRLPAWLACLCALHMQASAQGVSLSAAAAANDVIVEARQEGAASEDPVLRAIWRGVQGGRPRFELQRPSSTVAEGRLMLDRLVEAAIGAYLDEQLHFTKEGVRCDVPAALMAAEIDGLVGAAADALSPGAPFHGLTASTRQQLDRLSRIDWSKAMFGVDGGAEQDKYLAVYYYVRTQRQELERQLRADLLPLSDVALFAMEEPSPGHTLKVNSTCGTVFDQENYLCALDLRMADGGNAIGGDPRLSSEVLRTISASANAPTSAPTPSRPVRKRDRWLKEELDAIQMRIDRMDQRQELWELRDRMDDIEDRLAGLEMDLDGMRRSTAEENPVASLAALTGRNITIRFARSSVALLPDQRVLLNEVFEQLARSPLDKVLITGFTDRSGDPDANLRLSEQRAKAVRGYLMARGISAERLLVNFYGDSRSLRRDPDERRVEVEWIR